MARAGAVLVKLGRADAGRKLIDEAARDAAKLGTENRAGYDRALVAGSAGPVRPEAGARAHRADQGRENDAGGRRMPGRKDRRRDRETDTTPGRSPWSDTVGGNAFYHELARTAIAYKIGADRPDEAIKIIEGMKRNQWAANWQAEAFGWLAVALAPRDRARAFGLIDRALAMMIDSPDAMGAGATRWPWPPASPSAHGGSATPTWRA